MIKQRSYPESLKPLPIWGLWKLEEDQNGRMTKVPYSALYSGRASSTNPLSWTQFEQAEKVLWDNPNKYNGVALFISQANGLVFIDLDHCIFEDGSISELASLVTNAFSDQFIERSQSGTGIHIITMGIFPRNIKNSKAGIEIYQDKRFVALTGDALVTGNPSISQTALDRLADQFITQEPDPANLKYQNLSASQSILNEDQWIIEHAKQHGKFLKLYEGDWKGAGYGSQSEADAALCRILSFWTNRNVEQIDRIFRSSGLYREKWKRDDYRNSTIQKVLLLNDESLNDWRKRANERYAERLDYAMRNEWSNEI